MLNLSLAVSSPPPPPAQKKIFFFFWREDDWGKMGRGKQKADVKVVCV